MEYELKDVNGSKIKLYYSFTTDFMRVDVNINGKNIKVLLPIISHFDLLRLLKSIVEFAGYDPISEIGNKKSNEIFDEIRTIQDGLYRTSPSLVEEEYIKLVNNDSYVTKSLKKSDGDIYKEEYIWNNDFRRGEIKISVLDIPVNPYSELRRRENTLNARKKKFFNENIKLPFRIIAETFYIYSMIDLAEVLLEESICIYLGNKRKVYYNIKKLMSPLGYKNVHVNYKEDCIGCESGAVESENAILIYGEPYTTPYGFKITQNGESFGQVKIEVYFNTLADNDTVIEEIGKPIEKVRDKNTNLNAIARFIAKEIGIDYKDIDLKLIETGISWLANS